MIIPLVAKSITDRLLHPEQCRSLFFFSCRSADILHYLLTWSFLTQQGTVWCIIRRWIVEQRTLLLYATGCWETIITIHYCQQREKVLRCLSDQQGERRILLFFPPRVGVDLCFHHIWIKPVSRKTPLAFFLLSAKDRLVLYFLPRCSLDSHLS